MVMRRGFAGLVAVALAAAVGMTTSAAAVAPDVSAAQVPLRGGSPVPTARAGVAVVPFDPADVYFRTLDARWLRRESLAVVAPRESPSVRITLPPEVLAFSDVLTEMGLGGLDASDNGVTLTSIAVDVESSREVVIDLPGALQTAAAAGMARPDHLQLVANVDVPGAKVWLVVEIDLTDDAPAGEVVHVLEMPDRALDRSVFRFEYSMSVLGRVGPGTELRVEAPPGYWTEDVAGEPRLVLKDTFSVEYATVTPIVSADGGTLTATMPAGVTANSRLVVDLQGVSAFDRHLELWLLPPLTDPVAAYVTAVYNDLFGRNPDPGGLTTWTNALSTGTRYSAVADAITSSAEFRSGLIRDAYAYYLGRQPDPSGLAFWLDQMRRGMHIQQMEAGFLASTEYYGYAGGTDAGWVRSLYLDVLGREPAPSEVQFWVPIVRSHGRGEVAKGFLYSTERLTFDVDGYYQWLLHRRLDPAGRTSWVRAIQAGTRVEAIIAGIISSAEYRNNVPVG